MERLAIKTSQSDLCDHSDPVDDSLELTILMPCLNEAQTLAICIHKAQDFLEKSGIKGEVLIADNGSKDGSQDIAAANGARVVAVSARGYGAALIGGISAARGQFTIMGDADDSYDFSQLMSFVTKLREGNELVMGNRFAGGIADGAMPPLHRYLGNPVLSYVGRLFFRIPVRDFHCGLRGFNTAAIRRLGLATTGMEFASEMVVRSCLEGLRLSEVPTTLKPDGRGRPPHLNTWRDGWRHLKFLLIHSPKWLFFIPGMTFLLVGIVMVAALAASSAMLPWGAVLGMNSFAAACFMVICGVQLLSFGILSRAYVSIAGILPTGSRTQWILETFTTESVLRFAGVAFVTGVALFATALHAWALAGYHDLEAAWAPRAVIGGLTLVTIAIQAAFQSFMIGIFNIPYVGARNKQQQD